MRAAPTVSLALILLSTLFLSFYIVIRALSLFHTGYLLLDRIFSVLLFSAELFLYIHGIGHILDVIKSVTRYEEVEKRYFVKNLESKVAVFIPSFHEQKEVLEETIASVRSMDYEHKEIFLLDDSTKEEFARIAEDLARRYKVRYIHRENRRGFKAGAINDALNLIDAKYLAIFDADQKPSPSFLREGVGLLEEDPKLAFVQVPQYYSNMGQSRVANAAAHQQAVFFTYISEGKNVSNAMFSCGTNCVFKTEILRSVGGLDERTVTEDIATSFTLHSQGFKSLYYDKVFVEGEGPTVLPAYFTQQMRWAVGNFGLMKRIFKGMILAPRRMRFAQWWEYFLSSTWYSVGWTYFLLMLCPIAFLLFDIRPLVLEPMLYVAAFAPYLIFSFLFFFSAMNKLGYTVKSTWLGQVLIFLTFPIYMVAFISAIIGKRISFKVTAKGKVAGGSMPLIKLWPQILMLTLCAVSAMIGAVKVILSYDWTTIVNIVWASYYAILLSGIFYFNQGSKEGYGDYMIFKAYSD